MGCFCHFHGYIQCFPRLETLNDCAQTVDFRPCVSNLFVGFYRMVHIHFCCCFGSIHVVNKNITLDFFSGVDQWFLAGIIPVDGVQCDTDTGNIRFQTGNVRTVTGTENIRHPFFVVYDAFLRIDFHNAQTHQFMQKWGTAAVQTDDSQFLHISYCHKYPQPFR